MEEKKLRKVERRFWKESVEGASGAPVLLGGQAEPEQIGEERVERPVTRPWKKEGEALDPTGAQGQAFGGAHFRRIVGRKRKGECTGDEVLTE
eukprot:4173659-Heterocapsa_arctica.AAC.1